MTEQCPPSGTTSTVFRPCVRRDIVSAMKAGAREASARWHAARLQRHRLRLQQLASKAAALRLERGLS